MIEAKEIVNKPTEQDLRNIFTSVFAQTKILQGLLTDAFEDYIFKNGIECKNIELGISPDMLTLRMGDYLLFHEVKEWTAKVG